MKGKRSSANLALISRPEAYFHELVTSALGNQKVRVQPETEFYLVNLLNQFITAENLYTRDAEGHFKEEPLAIMVKEALEEPKSENQRLLFRKVGDVCLYVAGFFHESLTRKQVDLKYYIEMGGGAYEQVRKSEAPPFREVYAELADKFPKFVDILGEVSEKTTPRTEKNLLRIYENWVTTRSSRLEKTLKAAGIIPSQTTKKSWQ